ncbi:MAG: hypothetical protein ACTHL0_17985 [Trinickia sp.]
MTEDDVPLVTAAGLASDGAPACGAALAADVATAALPPDEAPGAADAPATDAPFAAAGPDAPATPTSLAPCAWASESGISSAGEASRSFDACHAKYSAKTEKPAANALMRVGARRAG